MKSSHGSIAVSIFACLLAAAPSAGDRACTRVTDGPSFPLPLLADGIRIAETVWADLEGDGQKELLAIGRDRIRRTVVQTVPLSAGGGPARVIATVSGWGTTPSLIRRQSEVADVNGDGRDDLLLQLRPPPGPLVTLIARDGRLEEMGPRIDCVQWTRAGDYDGDGAAELVAAIGCSRAEGWSFDLLSFEGDAGWRSLGALAGLPDGYAHTSGDFDRDGDDEFVSFSPRAGQGRKLVYLGDAEAPLSTWNESDSWQPWYLSGLNFEEGGEDGFLVRFPHFGLARFDPAPETPELVRMTWAEPSAAGSNDPSYAADDIDGDGLIDISTLVGGWTSRLFLGLGRDAGFAEVWTDDIRGRRLLGGADVDGDGTNEGLFYRWMEDGIAAWDALDGGGFTDGLKRFPSPEAAMGIFRTSGADFNNDGLMDVLFWSGYRPAQVLLGDGHGGLEFASYLGMRSHYDQEVRISDLDHDGFLDLVTLDSSTDRLLQQWHGLGDGRFVPGTPVRLPYSPRRLLEGDIDRNGDTDFLSFHPWSDRYVTVHTFGDELRLGPEMSIGEHGNDRFEGHGLADLDADGTLDLFGFLVLADGEYGLVSHAVLPDGHVARSKAIWNGRFPAIPQRMTAADVDGDGDLDLFVQLKRIVERPNATLLNRGDGVFELVWTGPQRLDGNEGLYDLLDVDGDGFLDLVEREHGFRVRPGNGTGTFDSSLGAWASGGLESDLLMDVDADGVIDIFRWEESSSGRGRAFIAGKGRIAAADAAPPEVHLVLWPDSVQFEGPRRWALPRFFIGAAATDDCSHAMVTRRRIDLPALDPVVPVIFENAEMTTVGIYERPETGERLVLLTGRDETRARRLFTAARAAGGWEFPNGHLAALSHEPNYGPPPAEPGLDPSYRRIALFTLSGDLPTSASSTSPTEDLTFTLDARDSTGRSTSSSETLTSGLRRYCDLPASIPEVCID